VKPKMRNRGAHCRYSIIKFPQMFPHEKPVEVADGVMLVRRNTEKHYQWWRRDRQACSRETASQPPPTTSSQHC